VFHHVLFKVMIGWV